MKKELLNEIVINYESYSNSLLEYCSLYADTKSDLYKKCSGVMEKFKDFPIKTSSTKRISRLKLNYKEPPKKSYERQILSKDQTATKGKKMIHR